MAARSANAMQMPNLRMPTGYESEQRKIDMKRRIAQAMLAQGIAPDKINHWSQVLAKLAQTWVGKSEDKKATRMEDDMYGRLKEDYANRYGEYIAARDAGASNQELYDKFGTDPLISEAVKMHGDAVATGLKEREELVDSGGVEGYVKKGDYVGKPMPNDPNKPVWYNPDTGAIEANPVRGTAAMIAQGIFSPVPTDQPGQITPVYSMPWPGAKGAAPAGSDYSPQPKPRIPPGAMQMLIQDPSLAQAFDQKYGPGSAEEVIRSTGRPYMIEEGPF